MKGMCENLISNHSFEIFLSEILARFISKILEGTNKAAKRREKYGCVSSDKIQGKTRNELICKLNDLGNIVNCLMIAITSEPISSVQ